jgi:rhodanese-related sulfurtransferase
MRPARILAAVAAVIAVGAALAGCTAADPVELTAETVVIDVRTPAEYAEGHLDGAMLIDVQDPGFAETVGALPRDGVYLVYCRSGNRAGAAIAEMTELGFTDVTNIGGLDAAATVTGMPIVTG